MQYNPKSGDFEMREIRFKNESKSRSQIQKSEIEFENERLIISKANPVRCMECHGFNHTGPIWANYHFWPGAYGSNDDLLYGSFNKERLLRHGGYLSLTNLKFPRSQGRALDLPEKASDLELNGYLDYLAAAPKHNRYRHLPPQAVESGFRKFAAGQSASEISATPDIEAEITQLRINEPDRMNKYFSDKLLQLSLHSLQLKIATVPGLTEKVREILKVESGHYAYAWGEQRFGDFDDFEPKLRKSLPQAWFQELLAKYGPFQENLNRNLRAELQMQDLKTKRAERLLGVHLRIEPGWEQAFPHTGQTVSAYAKLLGRPLTRTEILSLEWETGSSELLTLLEYVLRDAGIDLWSYDTNCEFLNNTCERRPSFHSENLDPLYRLYGLPIDGYE